MEKRALAWMQAAPCGLEKIRGRAAALLFVIAVSSVNSSWAQTISFTDQQSLLEAFRKQQSQRTTAPQTYTSPSFDLSSDSASAAMPPQLPSFDTTVVADVDSMLYDDSLPKPGGRLVGFGSEFFRSRGEGFKPPSGPVPPGYRLGPGDRLFITTWGRVDLEYDLAVDPTGQVYVPKVGAVRAFGLSLSDFQEKLRERLGTMYTDFELSVTVSQIRAVQVQVYGEVVRPGAYTLNALSSLLDVLTAAGGPNDRGTYRNIQHTQKVGKKVEVDLYRFFAEGDMTGDLPVGDGDIVFVPVAGPRVKMRGEVRRPGIYEMTDSTLLSDLIGLAGGASPDAYLGRVLVDRIDSGDQRKVLDCDLADGYPAKENIVLQDGDDISIYKAYGARANVVWVAGAVKHPGGYEHVPGMTVASLLKASGGLVPEAYIERADLERNPSDAPSSLIQVSLSPSSEETWSGPEVEPRDRLVVYDRAHLERPRRVHIAGAVKSPGDYELFEGMRLSDLVFRAGNPNRSAYLYRAEIARLEDGGGTQIMYADLGDVMATKAGTADPVLAEDDYVFVREIPRWRKQELVELEGEFQFPGQYAISAQTETFWDLITRSGGLTAEAFVQGTVFTRKSISEQIERADYNRVAQSSMELRIDTLGIIRPAAAVQIDPERMTRLVIDMERLVSTGGREGNVILRNGDKIYIPRTPSGIQVMGAVAAPGTILYEPDHHVKHYIDRAGDYTKQSQKKGVRLIKADGRVFAGGDARSQNVELGDAIFIPSEIKRDRDWWKVITGSVTLITGMVTMAVLLAQL